LTKPKPKTGEPRKANQPLKIDLLPQVVRDAIKKLYDYGTTWKEIEDRSAQPYSKDWEKDGGGFIDWESIELKVLEHFPEMRLPKSSVHRWFDLRIRQVHDQVMLESARAREWATAIASQTMPQGNAAVINAMRDQVFGLMQQVGKGDTAKFLTGLNLLALTMSRLQRVELQAKRVDAELLKIEAERAKLAAEAGDPREIYLLASQHLLKALRSREAVRAVIDPIKEELIQEFTHGAEAFSKQIEATAA
jgi:hypothetical protein